jgi:cytochrome c peroxidase
LKKLFCIILIVAGLMASCAKEDHLASQTEVLQNIEVPSFFPPIVFPQDNPFSPEKWLLGRKLFYDKRLSIDSSLSCSSCHKQAFAFADNVPTSDGVMSRPGTRNVPSLSNVAFHPYYTREGGLPTLEMQILVPIQEHNEFDFNVVPIISRLASDVGYQDLAMKAFGRQLDAYALVRSIATFERSLITSNSRYDRYFYQNRKEALTLDEIRGMDLFYSAKTNCSKCHTGFDLTTYQFANNGLYETYADNGRYRLTQKEEDLAMFKIPSLRNSALTAPYMHNGSLPTLEAVVEHYNSGGKAHINKSKFIKPLHLNEDDKQRLVLFLKTLSDEDFVNNTTFKNK